MFLYDSLSIAFQRDLKRREREIEMRKQIEQ